MRPDKTTVRDGLLFSLLASVYLLAVLRFNPRLFLQDYPEPLQQRVPRKSDREKRQSLVAGIPFLLLLFAGPFLSTWARKRSGGVRSFSRLFAHAFGVAFFFNLVDLILLDWLLFATLTPRFLTIPGTEGAPEYKDYGYHFRAFLVGTVISLAGGVGVGGVVWLL